MIHSIPYFLLYFLFASFHHSMFHSLHLCFILSLIFILLYSLSASFHHSLFHPLHLCFILSLTFSYCVPSLLYSNPFSVILSQFILNFLPLWFMPSSLLFTLFFINLFISSSLCFTPLIYIPSIYVSFHYTRSVSFNPNSFIVTLFSFHLSLHRENVQ